MLFMDIPMSCSIFVQNIIQKVLLQPSNPGVGLKLEWDFKDNFLWSVKTFYTRVFFNHWHAFRLYSMGDDWWKYQ